MAKILLYPKTKYVVLLLLLIIPIVSFSQTADFNVQHIQHDIGNSASTNQTITAVSSLNNAFVLVNNNRKSHAGRSDLNAVNLDGDDMSGATVLTAVNTLTYYRESASVNANTRFNSSIWEYVGPSGGANEMLVRGRYAISLNGTTNSLTQALTGVANANKCIPFITGILNNATNDDADSGTAIAYLENATTLRVQKGSNANNVTVYITVVEFTGSNWTVLHGDSGDVSADIGTITLRDGADGTGTATNVSAWSEAALFGQFRADNNANGVDDAIADLWPVLDPGTNLDEVDWTFHADHVSAQATNRHFVHVLLNSNLNVTRYSSNTSSGTGGDPNNNIDITSASLSSIDEALIIGSSTSSGGGTAYGRGWRNYYLNSTTQAVHWSHRSGNTMAYEIQIVDLSGLTTTVSSPEINVQGNGNDITDGFTTISTTYDTDFGSVDISSGTVTHTFTIQNTGTADLSVTNITSDNTHFSISNITLPSTISSSGSVTFDVTFDPTVVGTETATITITNTDGDEASYEFDVEGIGFALLPEINVQGNGNDITDGFTTISTTYDTDFGSVDVSSGTVTHTFTIQNTGTADLSVTNITSDNTHFTISNITLPSTVSSSGSVTFDVTFDPTVVGTETATITITNTDGDEASYEFDVEGIGFVPLPEINVQGNGNDITDGFTTISNTYDTDFGSVIYSVETQSKTFTIQNTDLGDLSVSAISSSNSHFTISNIVLPATISSSGSVTFVVTFDPTVATTETSTITITNNDSDEGSYEFNVQGIGLEPVYSNVTVSVDWPNYSEENTVEIYSPSGVLIGGFSDTTNPLNNQSYSASINLGCIVNRDNYYMVMYDTSNDGWDGADNITITVEGVDVINQNGDTASSGGTTVNFNVNGTATAEMQILGNNVEIADEDVTPNLTDLTNFGGVDVTSGSLIRTFTIENIGCNTLSLTDGSPYVSISGTNAADFSVSTIPNSTIASYGTTDFEITFNPSALGLRTATISIANDDSDEDPYNFAIQGTGVNPAVCTTTISSFPYTESFESGLGSWEQDATDDYDWTTITGATPSSNTGPDGAYNGSDYIFIEASNPRVSGDTANLTSPCFNLSGTLNPRITLFYHMYGEDMGTLNIEMSLDAGATFSTVLFSKTGQVHNDYDSEWIPLSFDLSDYIGQNVQFRIQGIRGDDYSGDIAIDYVSVFDTPNPTGAPGGVSAHIGNWLKANDGLSYSDGQSVSLWTDQGKGGNARVLNTGQEPTYRDNATQNVNFNPVIEFSNPYATYTLDSDYSYDLTTNSEFLVGDYGFHTQDLFVVIIPDDTPVNSSFGFMDVFCGDAFLGTNEEDGTGIGFGDYSARVDNEIIIYAHSTFNRKLLGDGFAVSEVGTGSSYTNVGIINARNNLAENSQELYRNADNIGNTISNGIHFNNTSDTRYWIGRSEGWESSMNGRVAEIISYSARKNDSDLTQERNRIQSYLAVKYGITLGFNGISQDYVDSQGSVIWDQSVHSGFNYDIAGIGRDEASELNQKQSRSVNDNDDIIIGLTNIYDTNNENITTNSANTFSDRNFLMWGNDNASLNQGSVVNVDMSGGPEVSVIGGTWVDFTPIERIWKVVEIGSIGTVEVAVPESILTSTIPLPDPGGKYLMFISNSPAFSPTSEYRVMNLNGSHLETTYDFEGTKYITFGYAPEREYVRSIWFDGSVDYLDAGDVLDLNTSFTISSWVKRENGNSTIVSKRDDSFTSGYDFGINASGNAEMTWINGGSQTITSSVVIPTNQWHHLAVTFNGTTARMYIDGVEDTTASLNAPVANTESFIIAAADGDEVNTTSFFQGNIDEVRVWDVALTEDQLRFIMNQEIEDNTQVAGEYFNTILGVTPTKNDIAAIPWSNLQGYYPMSTYTFTNCKDESGNGNIAALKNLNTVAHQTAPLPYVSSTDGSWDNSTTWTNGSVQTIPGSASIVDNSVTVDWNIVQISSDVTLTNSSLPSGNNGNRNVLGLIVDNTYELEVQGTSDTTDGEGSGNGITVSHYLSLDGRLDLEGESQLIQTDDSDLDTGINGEIEKDQQGTESSYNYNYWSSSVGAKSASSSNTNYTIAGVMKDGRSESQPNITFSTNYAAADGSSIPTPMIISTYWLRTFHGTSDDYGSWSNPLIPASTSLSPGEGFTMKGVNGSAAFSDYHNLLFVGRPNNGDITLTLTNGNDRLIGNPYPSAIDANEFILDNISDSGGRAASNIFNGALYFWHHFSKTNHNLAEYVGGYATYTLMGRTSAIASDARINNTGADGVTQTERFIPVNQGFFVYTSLDASIAGTVSPITGTTSPGTPGQTITFRNSQRVYQPEGANSGTGSIFFKQNSKKETTKHGVQVVDNRQKIRLRFDSPKGYHRDILVGLDEVASDNFDIGYDGQMADVGIEDMYWMLEEAKLVIQALPDFSKEREIPFGFRVDDSGDVEISIDELLNIEENLAICIKDLQTEEVYDLREESFKMFFEKGEYNDRFALVFQPRYYSLSEVELEDGIFIHMNNNDSVLEIQRIVETEVLNIQLFNYLGQTMASWTTNLEERIISKSINNLATGMYIVQINTKDGIINKKIIIE